MSVVPFDFTGEKIKDSYPRVMQWSGSDDVVRDGFGDPIPLIDVPVSYSNAGYSASFSTVQGALDYLLYVSPLITSFTNNIGTVETGSLISSVLLNWSYNKTMTNASLTDVPFITGSITSYEFVTGSVSLTKNKTYTLLAGDGTNNTTSTTTLYFINKRYWGIHPSASIVDADILGFSSEFATSLAKSFTISGGGQYIYYCYPARFGTATFTVNGLLNTAWTLSVQSFTNTSGFSENYNVYRTNTVQFGTGINIVVS